MSDKAVDILDANRRAMIISGKISDFQINNLKGWPSLLFDKFKVTLTYDFTSKKEDEFMSAGIITYNFVFQEDADLEGYSKKLQQITDWVHVLFWKDTEVKFLKDDKEWI
jgi:hypothetical protein